MNPSQPAGPLAPESPTGAREGALDGAGQLSHAERDLSDFAYVAAHDLRAPIRAIETLARFVLEDSGEALSSRSRHDVTEIVDRARRLMEQLDVLLAYARIGADERAREAVDIGRLLRELAELYLPGDAFTLELGDDLPTVEAPEAAVDLVFRNLLLNAVKHHDRSTGRVSVTCRADDGAWTFLVSDDGPGIDPEQAEAVFALFRTLRRRSGDSSSDSGSGSGMGLALVRRALEALGGTVRLVPHQGRGATFEVRWPRS